VAGERQPFGSHGMRARGAASSSGALVGTPGARPQQRGSASDLFSRERGRVVLENSRSVEASPRGDFTRSGGVQRHRQLPAHVPRNKARDPATTSSTRESSAGSNAAAPSAAATPTPSPSHQHEPGLRLRQPPRDDVARLQLRSAWPNLELLDKDVEVLQEWHQSMCVRANNFSELQCPYPWLDPASPGQGPAKPQEVLQELNLERPFTFSDFKRDYCDYPDDGNFSAWLDDMARISKENINIVNGSKPQLRCQSKDSYPEALSSSAASERLDRLAPRREPLGPTAAAVRVGASPPSAGGRPAVGSSFVTSSERLKQRSLDRSHSFHSLTASLERGRSREKDVGVVGAPPASPKPPSRLQRSAR